MLHNHWAKMANFNCSFVSVWGENSAIDLNQLYGRCNTLWNLQGTPIASHAKSNRCDTSYSGNVRRTKLPPSKRFAYIFAPNTWTARWIPHCAGEFNNSRDSITMLILCSATTGRAVELQFNLKGYSLNKKIQYLHSTQNTQTKKSL